MGFGTTIGDLKDYHRDPFPHALLRTREKGVRRLGLRALMGFKV